MLFMIKDDGNAIAIFLNYTTTILTVSESEHLHITFHL